ncbi:hypothetical protein NPIL_663561 [Nephila pilipes]|uniref:Uncharacterized protein n=1 Tax=Nephila pilipes TaxID=299642 RepID=A0A8X6MY54_NEPPI|nr:hypothetical protein NPIL_663561 [Nephila pilipes]
MFNGICNWGQLLLRWMSAGTYNISSKADSIGQNIVDESYSLHTSMVWNICVYVEITTEFDDLKEFWHFFTFKVQRK